MFLIPIISQASYEFDNNTNKKRVDEGYIEKNLKSSGYWNLEFKIHIDNNWSETKSTYDWCSGSGTWSDPYVIENVTVNGGNSGSPIIIENSNVYFRIKNCTVYNSTRGIFLGPYDGGITMINVTKGTLINNIAFYNEVGIYLHSCFENEILGNVITNNDYGICLYSSTNNEIVNNTANNNHYGILLYYSIFNYIVNNTANNNHYGICLNNSNTNDIVNSIVNNNDYGIYLDNSNTVDIVTNKANNNTYSGIILDESNNNVVCGNSANYNNKSGISLYYTYNNNVSGNIANNNYYGINLTASRFNDITGNTLFDNNVCYSYDRTCYGNTFKNFMCGKDEPSADDLIISGVIGIIFTSIILIGLSVLYWQFKRKVK